MEQKRIAKIIAEMKQQDLGAILICPSEEMRFVAGFAPMMCERFQGLFISAAGDVFYICNLLYHGEVAHALGSDVPIYTWQDGESMTDLVGEVLATYGLRGIRLGVNSTAQAFNVLDIARDCGITAVNALPVLEEARIIKDAAEIAALRQAASIADAAFTAVLDFIKPGQMEGDIANFISAKMVELGGSHPWVIAASGPNSSYPHYQGHDRVLEETDIIILDYGCAVQGLFSDMSRTLFIGSIDDEKRKIYDIVLRANKAAEAKAVNGAFIPDIDEAARSIIRTAGYGDCFINRVGHGIGYMLHEAPDIKKNNLRQLEPGMAFSIEPGIYLAGKFGMRIEDIVLATAQGQEILNHSPTDIIIL